MARRRSKSITEQQQPLTRSDQARLELNEEFSGPLPHPRILAQYDQVIPGLANSMVELVNKQAEHRMGLERRVIESNIAAEDRGQKFSVFIAVFAMGMGGWLINGGHEIYGAALIVGDGLAVATAFLQNRVSQGRLLKKQMNPFRDQSEVDEDS